MITVRPAQAQDLDAALRERVDLELSHGWELFVAEGDAGPVGMLAIKPAEHRLDQLFVDPAAQGQGVGRALMAFAKARMPDGMWLRTAVDNVRAAAWYEREGFVLDRAEPHPTFPRVYAYYRWGSPG